MHVRKGSIIAKLEYSGITDALLLAALFRKTHHIYINFETLLILCEFRVQIFLQNFIKE